MTDNLKKLTEKLNPDHLRENEPLSKHTTLRIGGPADLFLQPTSTDELIKAIKAARELEVSVTMLGWGANILVGDKGIRGLVIRNNSKEIQIGDEKPFIEEEKEDSEIIARWASASEEEGGKEMYEFKDLDYDESDKPIVEVRMDSGVDLPYAMSFLIGKGITGLQWYAKIPATIGGAIYNNIHGGTYHLHEIIKEVRVLTQENKIRILQSSELESGYDQSRFHHSEEIILDAVFNLRRGDKEKAMFAMKEWGRRKGAFQPSVSAGCIFKNITPEEASAKQYPTSSMGYIIEHVLKMGGERVGDAVISTKHHNFIENAGKASAADYRALIEKIQQKAASELGIELELEIFYLGEF